MEYLQSVKPFLRGEISDGKFGSLPLFNLLNIKRPAFWFSAHMHLKYRALYGSTRFSALNKNSKHGGWIEVLNCLQLEHLPKSEIIATIIHELFVENRLPINNK